MLKKLTIALSGIVTLFALAVTVRAASTTNTIVTPTSPVYDANNVIGVPGDFAPGFPTGSLASNGTAKTDMYFTPSALFGRDVTLGEIAKISYWTKKGTTHVVDPADWYLTIYTKPYASDVSSASWYGDRIGTEPYFSENLADPANTWNNWTTDGAVNKLRFFESTAGAPGANFGSYTDPDWATFVAGNALSGDPYAGHEVLFFSIQTGSAWAAGFTGQVDGLTITLADGSVANVNFESALLTPSSKDECKKDKWMSFNSPTFKNQGQCVSYVETRKHDEVLIESLVLNTSNSNGVTSSEILENGKTYKFVVSGEWTNRPGEKVDAKFTTMDDWLNWADAPSGGYDPKLLDVQVNDLFVDWGLYSSDHTYSINYTGDGNPVNFRVFDGDVSSGVINEGWYGDNNGDLTIKIFK